MSPARFVVAFSLGVLALVAPASAARPARPAAGLTFVRVTGGGEIGGAATFSVMRTTAGGRKRLVTGAGPLVWSPDGRFLLFTRLGPHGYALFVADSAGRAVRRIASQTSTGSWLAGSRTVVFSRLVSPNRYAVYRVDVRAKATPRKLFVLPGVPVWSPDGRSLVYAAGGELVVASGAGRHRRRLVHGTSLVSWSPDGTEVAYTRGSSICVTRVAVRATHCFEPAGGGADPSWSPDGSRLVYVRAGGHAIASAKPHGRDQRDLITTGSAIAHFETPVWQPVATH